jgi:hypothetical protein
MKKLLIILGILLLAGQAHAGTVTLANTKISLVDGIAFVDLGATINLATHPAGTAFSLCAATNPTHCITGYVKAAGTSESLTEKIVGGDCEAFTGSSPAQVVTGWTKHTSGGYAGTYTQEDTIKHANSHSQKINLANETYYLSTNTFALTAGKLYKISVWLQSDQSISASIDISSHIEALVSPNTIPANNWKNTIFYFVSVSSDTNGGEIYSTLAYTANFYIDDVSISSVDAPGSTGVTITSTAGGTTYNWATNTLTTSDYNDAGGYIYTITDQVATPTASPAAGTYGATQNVTLSTTTSGASIYYTTDLSAPACPSTGTLYTVPVVVSASESIKAIGCKAGETDSVVLTAAYTIRAPITYYISNAGADTNNGTTTGTSWAHIPGGTGCANNCAAVTLASGDIVSLNKGDTWANTTVTIPAGGTSSAPITLNSYGAAAAKPIVSAAANNATILISTTGKDYWVIDGLDLRSSGTYGVSGTNYALLMWPGGGSDPDVCAGWIIKNCSFNSGVLLSGPNSIFQDNIFDATGNTDITDGVVVRGSNASGTIVERNTIHDVQADAIHILRNVSNAVVRNNTIYNVTTGNAGFPQSIGINSDGFGNPVDGTKVYGNTISAVTGTNTIGIWMDTGYNLECYNNLIHDVTDSGIWASMSGTRQGVASNLKIHNNIIYNVTDALLVYWVSTATWANNTIYNASHSGFWIADDDTNVSALTFVNNILGSASTVPILVYSTKDIWTLFDYNDIVPNGTTIFNDGSNRALAYVQGLGYMTHGFTGDPVFISTTTPNFRLKNTSPCINKGVAVTGVTSDYSGVRIPIGIAPDVGAYEDPTGLLNAMFFGM